MLRSFLCVSVDNCVCVFVFVLGIDASFSFDRVLDVLWWWKPWKLCGYKMCANIVSSIFIHFVLDFPGRNNRQTDEDVATNGNQKRVYACSRDWRQDQKHPYHHGKAYTTCYTYCKVIKVCINKKLYNFNSVKLVYKSQSSEKDKKLQKITSY